MPTTYEGDSLAIADDASSIAIDLPSVSQLRNAASVNTPLESLADYLHLFFRRFKLYALANITRRINAAAPFDASESAGAACFADGYWVVGPGPIGAAETNTSQLAISGDYGRTWADLNVSGGFAGPEDLYINRILFNGAVVLAVGQGETSAYCSYGTPGANPLTGTAESAVFGGSLGDGGAVYDAWHDTDSNLTVFVGKDDNGALISSAPGNAAPVFTKRYDPNNGASRELTRVKKLNGLWIAVGANGQIVTSSDGASWTARTSGTTEYLLDVDYSPDLGLYVAAGNQACLTSPDGITWTSRTIDFDGDGCYRVAWGNGVFVLTGENSSINYSTDGITWTQVDLSATFGGSAQVTRLIFDGHYFVIAGDGGIAMRSLDGISWTQVLHGMSTDAITVLEFAQEAGQYLLANNDAELSASLPTL